jgi:putative peptidoglycan lipid II flippase
MSKLFRASLIMTVFFGINKIVALLRQYLITKQYGLSAEIDAFNVSNNLPDLLFSLIAGSALALAIIPVLTEYFDLKGKQEAWLLFSRVTNSVFILTAILAALAAIFAYPLISSPLGVAPGFTETQKQLTVELMRLNLIATLIFSISGIIMSGLQANKHFFLPAVAPIFYNIGQIFGILVLAPVFGLGVHGLVYGIILGAAFHLLIQIPGLLKYKFKWTPSFGLKDKGVQKVIQLMGPRILTVLCIQIMFLTRDNLASRLQEGTVSALTYGYYILQVPETLIGTAIATALLPTLSEFVDEKKRKEFGEVIMKSIRVMFALTTIITVISLVSLSPFVSALFGLSEGSNSLLVWVTNAYMIGLLTQSLLEVTTRAFYAKQDSVTPFWITVGRTILFITLSIALMGPWGPVGLALADTITVTAVVGYSLYLLRKDLKNFADMKSTVINTLLGGFVAVGIITGFSYLPLPVLVKTTLGVLIGGGLSLIFIQKELKLLLKL